MQKQTDVTKSSWGCKLVHSACLARLNRFLPWRRGLLIVLSGTLCLFLAPGCRMGKLALNEAILVSYRDMVWAKRAYNLRYGNCDRPYGEHFYNGFCQGYADVSNGGDGYVPALPPSAYRVPRFQSADGAKCVNAWFEGYPAGVAAARQEKVGNYNNVVVSKMVDSAAKIEKNAARILPSDIPVTSSSAPSSGEATPSLSLPPNPDSTSSVLIPSKIDSFEPVRPLGTNLSSKVHSGSPQAKSQVPALMPPIVTGSGIDRQAQISPSDNPDAPSSSLRRIR
jgi:hypothetical protein